MPSDALPDDPETLKAMLLAERVQNERLRQIIKELQRHRFGRRAEPLPEDQMLLGLEEVEQAEANRAAQTDGSSPADRQARAHKRRITGARCQRICRGLRSLSTSTTRPAPAARANCTGSARTRMSGWISCRRSSGCWSPGGTNMPAGLARTVSCRPRRRRG
jgi:Transposase C of IS166 homeodomain